MASQRSVRLLLLSGLALLIAVSVIGNARWLAAEGYLRFSEQRGQNVETRAAARQASDLALKLRPQSARALGAMASNDLYLGKADLALEEYSKALVFAPADAYLWRDYALALMQAGIFDARLERAVIQAQTWARKSKLIHLSLAVPGLKLYQQSSPKLRELWLKSIRFSYFYEPDTILLTAYVAEEELLLCRGDIIAQPGTNPWCAAARWRHGLCSSTGTESGSCFRWKEKGATP